MRRRLGYAASILSGFSVLASFAALLALSDFVQLAYLGLTGTGGPGVDGLTRQAVLVLCLGAEAVLLQAFALMCLDQAALAEQKKPEPAASWTNGTQSIEERMKAPDGFVRVCFSNGPSVIVAGFMAAFLLFCTSWRLGLVALLGITIAYRMHGSIGKKERKGQVASGAAIPLQVWHGQKAGNRRIFAASALDTTVFSPRWCRAVVHLYGIFLQRCISHGSTLRRLVAVVLLGVFLAGLPAGVLFLTPAASLGQYGLAVALYLCLQMIVGALFAGRHEAYSTNR